MTDKSDLIEQIKLHVGFMKDCDNWVSDDHHSNVIKKLCIESDEAREYWRGQDYDIQQRAVQLAVLVERTRFIVERTRFIEQACEAVENVHTNSKAPGFNNGYDHCKEKVKQAIRDKFEGEK